MNKGQISNFLVVVAILALIIGGVVGWSLRPIVGAAQTQTKPIQVNEVRGDSKSEVLSKNMRKLWEDHITWTRLYLVSAIEENNGTDVVVNRLLKNQEDIGNAVKPYYGNEAGEKLTELLKTHITTAADIVSAAKQGNQNAQSAAEKKWYDNANEIADFLNGANPNWDKSEMRVMMKDHLDLTRQEAVNLLGKKYEASIADYDAIHNQILSMADSLTEGIVKQFPDKFK